MSPGVPEAGLLLAAAMMIGIAFTLAAVALAAAFSRHWVLENFQRRRHLLNVMSHALEGVECDNLEPVTQDEALRARCGLAIIGSSVGCFAV